MILVFLSLFLMQLSQDRDEQTRLEMKHRKEEDDLYRKFAHHREEEDRRIREEFRVRMSLSSVMAEQLNRESGTKQNLVIGIEECGNDFVKLMLELFLQNQYLMIVYD